MKILQSKIYFEKKEIAKVICEEPYKEVKIIGSDIILPDYYFVELALENNKKRIINKKENPVDYVLYLYLAVKGDYVWAGQAEIIEK